MTPRTPRRRPSRADDHLRGYGRARATAGPVRSSGQEQPAPVTVGGYLDIGYFVPGGNNGAGYVEDFGHTRFPAYGGFGWVFLGDILAPAVNSRGEVADLGTAPGVDRYDTINSRGAPGFIVNEINVTLRSALTPTALVTASIDFTPRTGNNFSLGDVYDADIAQVEWLPTESQRTSIFVGKTDSVLGIEYRDRKSDKRFGITPSLIARYTTGTALGVKVRSKFGRRRLAGVRRGGDQRLEHHRDVALLRRDRQQRRQDRQRRGCRCGCRCRSGWSSAPRGATARRIGRPTRRTRCGSSAATCWRTSAAASI